MELEALDGGTRAACCRHQGGAGRVGRARRGGRVEAGRKRVEARAPSGWTRTGPARGRPLAGPRSRVAGLPPPVSK